MVTRSSGDSLPPIVNGLCWLVYPNADYGIYLASFIMVVMIYGPPEYFLKDLDIFSSILSTKEGRRDYQGSDLRDKLDRRHSPPQKYSPVRDARGRQTLRDYSSSRSLERKRTRRKKLDFDGQGDFSESLRISEGTEDQVKEGKITSTDLKDVLEEQLKKVQSEVNVLDHRKFQLGVCLEERVQEADSLTSRIQELEAQLHKEKEERKRSQVRLQKFGDQLGLDISRNGANEEDSINILSDGETIGFPVTSPHNELPSDASPGKKRLCVNLDPSEETKQGGHLDKTDRFKKLSRWNVQPAQSNQGKEMELMNKAVNDEICSPRPLVYGGKRGKTVPTSIITADKIKGLEPALVVPSTSMAGHVLDEEVEIELEDKIEVTETAATRIEKGRAYEIIDMSFPLPPPPPIHQANYSLHEGDDGNVDVDGLEMVHVDIV
uniref:Uncharacterized protein n=1 Tax=Fagus sylvatica TaxID=28930 RepID=A0A2N9E4L9_FAGSY